MGENGSTKIKALRILYEDGSERTLIPAGDTVAGIDEAAVLLGRSPTQMYRYLRDDETREEMFPGAHKVAGNTSPWTIPLADLAAVLTDRWGAPVTVPDLEAAVAAMREGEDVPELRPATVPAE